jgi:DNA ligase-1
MSEHQIDRSVTANILFLFFNMASIESIGGEGLMLRKGGSSYEQKRSNSLLKVKSMMDAEAKVIGHQTGKGRNSDRLGALVCQLVDNTGKTFKVGSGLTDAERENPPSIGAIITFSFFEYTKSGVPRFPTYKRVFPGN